MNLIPVSLKRPMMTATPMLSQYRQIKSQHKDCILFFRLGDFYEMFYDDALAASGILDLVLTARGKGTDHQVPMCGVPYHSADGYIAKLIQAGKKVAICEQLEDPSQAQGIVKRDVIRIITSGTYLDENSQDARYLLCLNPHKKSDGALGVAFIDPTCGAIQTNQYQTSQRVIELISKLPIYECVYPISEETAIKDIFRHPLLRAKNIILSPHDDWCFNPDIAKKSLCEHFNLQSLGGFGIEDRSSAVASAGALLEYLKQMNKQPLKHIDKVSLYADDDYAFISPAAVYGLELDQLFKTINLTSSAMGRRKLNYWLTHPLKRPADILQRQAAVTLLKEQPDIQKSLKKNLSVIPDVEKCLSKLSCGYTQPKDVLAIRNALSLIPEIQASLVALKSKNRLFSVEDVPQLRDLLNRAVNPEMPLSKTEGKVIQKGFDQELDALKDLRENGNQWLQKYQQQEIKRTGINTLKVGFNQVFGYYIEITNAQVKNAPSDYLRKQTLVNGERFITMELKEFEEKILTAQEKILKIENRILADLQREILEHSSILHNFSQAIATIDALFSMTLLALSAGFIAPEITEDLTINIEEGRHPVVEKAAVSPFVPNDILLNNLDQHLIILTGPNMAGKSTYIRQVAVLVILAQMGSYLPAKKAHIGIVDKIFTRIGAHDDITKGQSTFMVEMTEAADIVNNLSERSLVILDEIGRGTSTFDGLSLAWALAEHFQKTKARTLFATHFHELTVLAQDHPGVKNYNVAVKEWQEEIIFLHKIVPGSADDSYGIYVAKLAGLPSDIIKRSKNILSHLENQGNLKEGLQQSRSLKSGEDQLSFLTPKEDPILNKIKETLQAMDINQLTPIEALNKLQEMKQVACRKSQVRS